MTPKYKDNIFLKGYANIFLGHYKGYDCYYIFLSPFPYIVRVDAQQHLVWPISNDWPQLQIAQVTRVAYQAFLPTN